MPQWFIASLLLWVMGMPNRVVAATEGGTLRLALSEDPMTLDAGQLLTTAQGMLGYFLYNTLLDPSTNDTLTPVLLQSLPEVSKDGLNYTFRLRSGVCFSHGRELVVDDVVYTLTRFFDPAAATVNSSYFCGIAGGLEFMQARTRELADPTELARHGGKPWIEPLRVSGLQAVDQRTIQVRLSAPDLSFLRMLSCPSGCIVPRDVVEALGSRFASASVGTGRYVLTEWLRGSRLRFKRNPRFFQRDESGPDEVHVMLHVDGATQSMLFERGELDFLYKPPEPVSIQFRKDPALAGIMRIAAAATVPAVRMNCEMGPFTNRLVRQALNHAMDKAALLKAVDNRGLPSRGVIGAQVHGFEHSLPGYDHSPAQARKMLAQAGYSKGFEVDLWASVSDPTWMRIALLVQQCARDAGVTIQIRQMTDSAINSNSGRHGVIPMHVGNWTPAYDDPREFLDTLYNGSNIRDEGCLNSTFYLNPEVIQLFHLANGELDSERRLELYRTIERQVLCAGNLSAPARRRAPVPTLGPKLPPPPLLARHALRPRLARNRTAFAVVRRNAP